MNNIIINADDFGKDKKTTLAIVEAINLGICTNTTLMVNMPYADQAVALAKKYNFIEHVGLHINLTEGTPLSSSIKKIKTFCDDSGNFKEDFRFNKKKRLIMNTLETNAILEEIEAQIQKFIAYGFKTIHVDSHHHMHTNRPVLIILKKLITKYNIRSVRLSMNLYRQISLPIKIYKKKYNKTLKKYNILTTDFFGSLNDYINNFDKKLDSKTIEIMVHPTFKDNKLIDIGGVEENLENYINKLNDCKLISYKDL